MNSIWRTTTSPLFPSSPSSHSSLLPLYYDTSNMPPSPSPITRAPPLNDSGSDPPLPCFPFSPPTRPVIHSLWSIWTWTTELTVFLILPVVILIFNLLVIAEVRRLAALDIARGGPGARGLSKGDVHADKRKKGKSAEAVVGERVQMERGEGGGGGDGEGVRMVEQPQQWCFWQCRSIWF